jgi:hypothetical protein
MEDEEVDIHITDEDMHQDSDIEQLEQRITEGTEAQEADSLWRTDFPETVVPEFCGHAQGPRQLPYNVHSPLSWFSMFLPNQQFQHIQLHTNLYLAQWEIKNAHRHSRAQNMVKFTVDEIKTFIGIVMLHGLRPTPRIRLQWSNDPLFHNPVISRAMTLNRFEDLARFLHLADNSTAD